jgi:hypothetical protein
MRQVSPLPTGGAGIQFPNGKPERQRPLKNDTSAAADGDDAAEEEATPQSTPPPGMGMRVNRTV